MFFVCRCLQDGNDPGFPLGFLGIIRLSQTIPAQVWGLHCKRILGIHRGRIWVESEPGNGSISLYHPAFT
jgi:hypothetical protein